MENNFWSVILEEFVFWVQVGITLFCFLGGYFIGYQSAINDITGGGRK